MLIDFLELSAEHINNFHGGEKSTVLRLFKDDNNKILLGKLEAGASIGVHTHQTSSEIIYIVQGTGKVIYDGRYEQLCTGACHYCPKNHEHSLINDSDDDLIFFAVVPEQ